MPLLTVSNLSIAFQGFDPDQKKTIVKEVVHKLSFTLNKGEVLGIVGESGSGKSVTALSILQLLPSPQTTYPTGSIIYHHQELLGAKPSVLQSIRGKHISMIFQEPMTSLNPLHTIYKQLAESIQLHTPLEGKILKEKIFELLDLVELSKLKNRIFSYPHQLSGGQRQRVMIAMALATNPDILIADEPTTALDVTVQAKILKLLKRLQQQLGLSIILISHDLALVKQMANRILVMHHGNLVESGTTKEIFSSPQHAYTKHLLSSEIKQIVKQALSNEGPILEATNLTVSFPETKNFFGKVLTETHAVNNASLQLIKGQTLGIVGESGSGKTTLALALLKLLPSKGRIIYQGHDIMHVSQKAFHPFRKSLQIVFQDPYGSLNPRLPIYRIIEEGLAAHQLFPNHEERSHHIFTSLKEVGLDADMASRFPHEFSGGQRQRIAIARAIALKPDVIILDEPTSALDVSVQKHILELLASLQDKHGVSYIFISHDLRVIRAMSHQVMVLQSGNIVEVGDTETIFNHPQEVYTQTLLGAALAPFGND